MAGQQGMGEYNVDIVMCIDATGSMSPIIDEVKGNAISFYQRFVDSMEENDKEVAQLRIKVIVFRDYGCDDEPMVESQFYALPDQNDEFRSFVSSIEAKGGGDGPENALEAIALALKSDWTTGGSKRRHAILVFSDAPALRLGERSGSSSYPSGLPTESCISMRSFASRYYTRRKTAMKSETSTKKSYFPKQWSYTTILIIL